MRRVLAFILILLLCTSSAYGAQKLRADTEVIVRIGGFYDATDGITPETGITLGAADEAELLRHGVTATASIAGNTWAAITDCGGWYNLTLTAGNLDTEGTLTVVVQDVDVCVPVWKDFQVVNANVYDSLYAAATTDYLQVDTLQVGGATQSTDLDTIVADTNETLTAIVDPNIWYVAKDGSNANGGHSVGNAKLTISAAISAASAGDTIKVGPGTFAGKVIIASTKPGLKLIGSGIGSTIITSDETQGLYISGAEGCWIEGLSVINSHASGKGIEVRSGSDNTVVKDCYGEGPFDGIYNSASKNVHFIRCYGKSGYDGCYSDGDNAFFDECVFETTGASTSPTVNALRINDSYNTIIRNTSIIGLRALATADRSVVGLRVDGETGVRDTTVLLDNVSIYVNHSGTAEVNSDAYGIKCMTNGVVRGKNCLVKVVSTAAAGDGYGLHVDDESECYLNGVSFVLSGVTNRIFVESGGIAEISDVPATSFDDSGTIVADLDEIQTNLATPTLPSGTTTSGYEMLHQLYGRFFYKATATDDTITTYNSSGTSNATQSVTFDGATRTVNKAE